MRKTLFVLLFLVFGTNAYANIPATTPKQFVPSPIKSFFYVSLEEREAYGKRLYAKVLVYLMHRVNEEENVRDKAVFTTILEQPEKVRAFISVEENSVTFYGTYTDPLSGDERQFGYVLKILR